MFAGTPWYLRPVKERTDHAHDHREFQLTADGFAADRGLSGQAEVAAGVGAGRVGGGAVRGGGAGGARTGAEHALLHNIEGVCHMLA